MKHSLHLTVPLILLTAFMVTTVSAQVVRPLPVPGRIEAENYDTGGAGVSYYDDAAGNSGNVYRQDDVDIEATQDEGGGYNVGWVAAGEWLHYTVSVQETAVYQLSFRVAARDSSQRIQVTLDGLPFCAVAVPHTGGWQNWQTFNLGNLALRAGQHLLRIEFQTGGCNLNYIQATKQRNLTGNFLRVSGKQIVDGQGQNVLLRGMGLGNWMLQEPYMMDVSGIVDNQQQLKNKIAELVGTNNMNVFYASWLTNAFNSADVRAMAAYGFNSIRLPMHYNVFTPPADQEPVPGQNTWIESGFKLVDDLLSWCETNRIYLILDMHGCPGGQGHDKPISDYNPPAPSLWESSANRAKLVALWREIARRYAGKEWIGGYDLINEPNWTFENNSNINGCGDQSNAPLRQLLMDLTAAVRQVDTNHIIFLAGNCWGGNYNGILPPWDPNLVISFHRYWDDPSIGSFQGRVNMRDEWNMPLWLGESGENSNTWFRDLIRNAEILNIGWAWWPWKKIGTTAGTVMIQKPSGYQAILDYWRNGGTKPSTNAAFAALLALSQAARFENCVVHPDVVDALLRPNTRGVTLPFKSLSVPGIIFAVDYDMGQLGESYNDISYTNNSGSSYRNEGVDIEACSDAAPTLGYGVGWTEAGDWMKYTVTSRAAGPYALYARVAAQSSGGSFYIEVGGSNVTGVINVPATGGWQAWRTIPAGVIPAQQSLTSFKLVIVSGGFNLHWLTIKNAPATGAGLPPGWNGMDIGSPGIPGSAAVDTNEGIWFVNGGGADIWGTADQFHFVSRDLAADGSIIARVTDVPRTGNYPKAGVMFRASTQANSSYAYVFAGTNSVAFECRDGSGASSVSVGSASGAPPAWVKLTRAGTSFSGYTSADGNTWTLLGTRSFGMAGTLKAGLAVCAGNNSALNTAIMDNVLLLPVPPVISSAFSSTNLVLLWPASAADFSLYSTSNLSPPVVWSPVTNITTPSGTNLAVTLAFDANTRFFRLLFSY